MLGMEKKGLRSSREVSCPTEQPPGDLPYLARKDPNTALRQERRVEN